MASFTITPTVNQAKEFMEIAFDFGRPLELLREAISNAFDAKASRIRLLFSTELTKGVHVLKIVIEDNGTGMDRESLQAFFDLGNSPRHREKTTAGSSSASCLSPVLSGCPQPRRSPGRAEASSLIPIKSSEEPNLVNQEM